MQLSTHLSSNITTENHSALTWGMALPFVGVGTAREVDVSRFAVVYTDFGLRCLLSPSDEKTKFMYLYTGVTSEPN